MTKQEFVSHFRQGLWDLPKSEIDERLTFYIEMIDDYIENGSSEEDAVAEIGSVDEIIKQIRLETAPQMNKKREKRFKTSTIVLLAVSSPLWASLLIAAIAVIFSAYVSVWACVVSLWACFAACAACAPAGVVLGFTYIFSGNMLTGVAALGLSAFSAGLAIFLFFGCKELTRLTILLGKKAFTLTRHFFSKKEKEND